MSQRDDVLRMLTDAGPRGLHTFEMRRVFIGNPSQRIADLEASGVAIVHGPKERLNGAAVGVRYWLEEHAPTEPPEPVTASPTEEPAPALFEVAATARSPYSIYDDEAAA